MLNQSNYHKVKKVELIASCETIALNRTMHFRIDIRDETTLRDDEKFASSNERGLHS